MGTKSFSKFDRLYTKLLENLQDDDDTFYFWKIYTDQRGNAGGLILAYNNMTFKELIGTPIEHPGTDDPDSEWYNMTPWKLYQVEGGKMSPNAFITGINNNRVVILPDEWVDFDGEAHVFASKNYKALITAIYNFYKPGNTQKIIPSSNEYRKTQKVEIDPKKSIFIRYKDDPEKAGTEYITNITFSNIRPYHGDTQYPTLADFLPRNDDDDDEGDSWKRADDDDDE